MSGDGAGRFVGALVASMAWVGLAKAQAEPASPPPAPPPATTGSLPAAQPPAAAQPVPAQPAPQPPPAAQPAPAQPPPATGPPPPGTQPPPPGYSAATYPGGAPPPPPAQPPPYGAQPQYGYPQPPGWSYESRPAIIPYEEGRPVPPGYHAEDRIRKGPFITGIAIGGTFYLISVSVAAGDDFENQKGWLLVPGLGPWITLGLRDEVCDVSTFSSSTSSYSDRCEDYSAAKTLLVLDGLLQGTGVLLMAIGVAAPRTVLVRDDMAEVTLEPVSVGSGHGLGLTGKF